MLNTRNIKREIVPRISQFSLKDPDDGEITEWIMFTKLCGKPLGEIPQKNYIN